ncbi:MAG: ABC transporter substrate-binding protein [Candidatus Cyclobacteriaceae bacterium M2_1C_046]
MKYSIYLFLIISVISCNSNKKEEAEKFQSQSETIEYAKGFELESLNGIQRLTVKKPFQGATESMTYYLIPKHLQISDSLKGQNIIRTPIEEIVVTSTSHIPILDYIGVTEALTGFPTLDYISSAKMRSRIDSGFVKELGRDNQLNLEVLVKLQPEMVMTYMLTGDRNQLKRIEQAGIPVLINADYLEHHPLGRVEWIKVTGALFDKYRQADSVFNAIRDEYLSLQQKVSGIDIKPTVMTGIMYGDTWYLPGGDNYSANLLKDAGMDYLWQENQENGFLQLSFEAVYNKAKEADLWLGVASFDSLEEIKNADSRYTWFDAYKEGEVYTYTARIGATGGNEYLELGYLRPDIILADLVKIGHPEILKERELYFYKKLE